MALTVKCAILLSLAFASVASASKARVVIATSITEGIVEDWLEKHSYQYKVISKVEDHVVFTVKQGNVEGGWDELDNFLSGQPGVDFVDDRHDAFQAEGSGRKCTAEMPGYNQWYKQRITSGSPPKEIPAGYERGSYMAQGLDTSDTIVYIMDTGVDENPGEYQIVDQFDCVKDDPVLMARNPDEPPYEDAVGHGSAMASLIAGQSDGVAPNTPIVNVKILGAKGGSFASVIAGYQKVIEHHKNRSRAMGNGRRPKAVINASFGNTKAAVQHMPIFAVFEAFNRQLYKEGIVMVAAAGNVESMTGAMTCPSCFASDEKSGVISVGATAPNDELSTFPVGESCPGVVNSDGIGSARGEGVDLYAPGEAISVLQTNGVPRVWCGTSMSTPLVVGATVRFLSTRRNAPYPRQTKLRILEHAKTLNNAQVQNAKMLHIPCYHGRLEAR